MRKIQNRNKQEKWSEMQENNSSCWLCKFKQKENLQKLNNILDEDMKETEL